MNEQTFMGKLVAAITQKNTPQLSVAQLRQELREKEQQLQSAREQAELAKEQLLTQVQEQERLAAIGQLAAGIVHDFNNIMAVILLLTQVLRRTVSHPAKAHQHLETIEQQVNRAISLIQQILRFCRQEGSEPRMLDLKLLLNEMVHLLTRTLPDNIRVKLTTGQDEYVIFADPSCIQQVILNLAVNARDSLPTGGELIFSLNRIKLPADHIPGMPPGVWVQLSVQDNGVGIPSNILPHIFEPFFTTKEVGKGTGLGLTQAHKIVQQHDGYIDVQSETEKGTRFRLYFPAFTAVSLEKNVTRDTQLICGQGQLVLVVEDNLDTQEAVSDSLKLLDYQVLTASNGREALSMLLDRNNQIDLILSDVVMPEMGGVTLLHDLRRAGLPTPILFLTGHPTAEEFNELDVEGVAGWLPKPPDLEKLAILLNQALSAGD